MPRIKINPAKIIIYVILFIVTLIAVIVFHYFNPSLGFKYFEPSSLPPGVSIKQKRISILAGGYTVAEQDFRTVDWVYEIMEYKASGPEGEDNIGKANQNFSTSSMHPTCNILFTSKGQQYRLCHWIDYGRIGVYEVKFIKGGTFINSEIPTSLHQKITVHEISTYVDSFKAKWTLGIPVSRSNF